MPPEAHANGHDVPDAEAPPAVFVRLEVMSKRADFLRAARAKRAGQPGLLLQGRDRGDDAPARVGFTCSKKIGNAVARNRAKRRLREIAGLELGHKARPGWDYVLVGRPDETVSRPFDQLRANLVRAITKVHE